MIDVGPRNGPQNAPTSSPRGPQDALGARLPLEVGFGAILGPFWDPFGTPKIMLSLWRGAIFANFASRAREPEIAPQMVPKSTLKRPPEAPEWPEMSLQIGARILIKSQLRIWRFWSSNMTPKITQKTASEPRARPGPAQGPPRGLQIAFREAFWAHFGFNSVPPGAHVRAFSGCTFASFWLAACLLLVLFFSCVLSSAARLLSYQATRHRSPKR